MVSLISIGLVVFGAFIGSVAALIVKKESNKKYGILGLLKPSFMWFGFGLYALSTVFYIVALRNESLSVIYPFVSTVYLWTSLLSVKYLGEKMNITRRVSG